MRFFLTPILLLLFLVSCAQYGVDTSSRSHDDAAPYSHPRFGQWMGGTGLTFGTLNFNKNYAGSVSVPIRYNVPLGQHFSVSLGSEPKIGSEDRYGVVFPATLALLLAGGGRGNDHDLFDRSAFFADIPILLRLSVGLGSRRFSNDAVGFYISGGAGLTVTGFNNDADKAQSTSFYNWVMKAGFIFAKDVEINFSRNLPMRNPVGNIPHPVFYEIGIVYLWQVPK